MCAILCLIDRTDNNDRVCVNGAIQESVSIYRQPLANDESRHTFYYEVPVIRAPVVAR